MPTIKDVAERAGVTVTTVSRVLNNRGYISDLTKMKVHRAMDELDYRPNEVARSLSKQQTNCIGVILPSMEHPFFCKVLHWLEYYASRQGYKVMVCISQNEHRKELEYVDLLRSNRVGGIILCTRRGDFGGELETKFPIVTFEREIAENIPSVQCDNFQGGKLAAGCLLDAGCNNIAVFARTPDVNLPGNLRKDGFLKECKNRGLKGEIVCIHKKESNEFYDENDIIEKLEEHADLNGIFATSDVMAAQIIRACEILGKRIPKDLCLVGFNDISIAKLTVPSITTIHQPVEEMCEYAIEMIIKKAHNETIPSKIVLPVRVIERESVKKL